MRISKVLIAGAALTALTGLGGSAFTASNTVADSKAGIGSAEVSGIQASSIQYGLNGDHTTIDSVSLIAQGTVMPAHVQVALGHSSTGGSDPTDLALAGAFTCVAGSVVDGNTPYTCDTTTDGTGVDLAWMNHLTVIGND
jgi:hypothetical protein